MKLEKRAIFHHLIALHYLDYCQRKVKIKKIHNWRPIILSNCDYKIITKCYAKRLKNVIRNVLHPNQTA